MGGEEKEQVGRGCCPFRPLYDTYLSVDVKRNRGQIRDFPKYPNSGQRVATLRTEMQALPVLRMVRNNRRTCKPWGGDGRPLASRRVSVKPCHALPCLCQCCDGFSISHASAVLRRVLNKPCPASVANGSQEAAGGEGPWGDSGRPAGYIYPLTFFRYFSGNRCPFRASHAQQISMAHY